MTGKSWYYVSIDAQGAIANEEPQKKGNTTLHFLILVWIPDKNHSISPPLPIILRRPTFQHSRERTRKGGTQHSLPNRARRCNDKAGRWQRKDETCEHCCTKCELIYSAQKRWERTRKVDKRLDCEYPLERIHKIVCLSSGALLKKLF